ncbi:patatin-like phospholipase family protein [Roseiarcaceae bacterium H3SJ34-1]|uniref:patatin-like phospholipase family protein n=1 Tax=Terripilifer ovatus TaxID=3032367 RepID=UPI003AB92FB2|nr:patatin-like phospholipase family protein [Roseiarcaceae bacterium H3SJ34-1]
MSVSETSVPEPSVPDGFAVALGAGGARGLAHIVLVEALDDLGIKPLAIAGSSMGAFVGAAWAAGMRGRDIRQHALARLRNRAGALGRVMRARVGRFTDLLGGQLGNPILVDGEILLDLFWPDVVPDRFEQLAIPFLCVATDYFGGKETVFDSGPLGPAVAASIAIPGLLKPVEADGAFLIDGGVLTPLPWRNLAGRARFVLACDVTGSPGATEKIAPSPIEALVGSSQIMQGALVRNQLRDSPPDLLLRPPVDRFRALDFFRAIAILEAAAPMRDEIKRGVERLIAAA